MGNKVHPKVFRLGIVDDWDSSWFATSDYKFFILEDLKIRKYIKENFSRAGISNVKINRKSDKVEIVVKAARTGIVLGKGGDEVVKHRAALSQLLNMKVAIVCKFIILR